MGLFGKDKTDNDYYKKAAAYYKQNNFKNAIKYYNKTLEINPNYISAWNDKGLSLIRIGNFDEGIECYNKALEINPGYMLAFNNKVQAFNNRGASLVKMGKIDEGLKWYNKTLEINPNYVLSLMNKAGLCLSKFQKYEECIKCFDTILKLDENSIKEGIKNSSSYEYPNILAIVWNDKGTALFRLKRYIEAIKCYNNALRINPNYTLALNNKEKSEKALSELKNKICPKCGFENRQDSDYCENCGKSLKINSNKCINCGFENIENAKFCIECGTKLNNLPKNLFCPNCKTPINSSTKFCPKCGTKID